MKENKFSLIIGTFNRSEELSYCLKSICKQSYKNFEVIIVDQSLNDYTTKLVSKNSDIEIVYIKTEVTGLSHARNIALKKATGDFCCLIDDDAFYPSSYLEDLNMHIQRSNEKTIFTGKMWDSIMQKPFVNYDAIRDAAYMSIREVLRYCPSPCITFPSSLIKDIGYFDENFGVGAKYGSCEETDYLVRALNTGYRVKFIDSITVIHPHDMLRERTLKPLNKDKVYNYAVGFGAMVKKNITNHGFFYLNIYYVECILKDLGKIILRRNNATTEFRGHIDGFLHYELNRTKDY